MEAEIIPTDASILFIWRRVNAPDLSLTLKSLEFIVAYPYRLSAIPHLGSFNGGDYVPVSPGRQHAGWIEFDRPETRFKKEKELELKMFQPEEGMMLLFPSYFYHRVIPFSSDEERISISFDIVPDD